MRVSVLLATGLVAVATASNSNRRERAASKHQEVARNVNVSERDLIGGLLGSLGGLIGGILNGIEYPLSSFVCSGSGLDGFELDYNKKSCPSTYPSGFLYFGKAVGWGAPEGFSLPSTSWTPFSGFATSCAKWTWWAPQYTWVYPEAQRLSYPLDLWVSLGWHSYRGPESSWNCANTGLDGWSYDHKGAACPYSGFSDWKWYGSNYGWQPPSGWVPSGGWNSFVPPSGWVPSLASWWSPASIWIPLCPSSITKPGWWPSAPVTTTSAKTTTTTSVKPTTLTTTVKPTTTTTTTKKTTTTTTTTSQTPSPTVVRPAADWDCDGSGWDGYTVDPSGNSCPAYIAAAGATCDQTSTGWAYYGVSYGWLPSEAFNIPWPTWQTPTEFTLDRAKLATWWVPSSDWEYNPAWGLLPCDFWPELDPTWTSYLSSGEWVCTQQRRRVRAKRFH